MKLFRFLALMLAVGVFPVLTQAQQEVDPDHFETAQVAQASPHAAKAQSAHKSAHRGHTRLASKHSGKANHHRAHVSA